MQRKIEETMDALNRVVKLFEKSQNTEYFTCLRNGMKEQWWTALFQRKDRTISDPNTNTCLSDKNWFGFKVQRTLKTTLQKPFLVCVHQLCNMQGLQKLLTETKNLIIIVIDYNYHWPGVYLCMWFFNDVK